MTSDPATDALLGRTATSKPLRVFCLDDHPIVIEAIATALERSNAAVVGTARTVRGALAALETTEADVVLVDLSTDGDEMGGLAVAEELRLRDDAPEVVVLSADAAPETVRLAFAAGCTGFISKMTPAAQIAALVRQAASGNLALDPETARVLAADQVARLRAPEMVPLTERELEVLRAMSHGASNAEIATQMSSSESGIRKVVSRILTKLDAADRTAAVATALRAKLIE